MSAPTAWTVTNAHAASRGELPYSAGMQIQMDTEALENHSALSFIHTALDKCQKKLGGKMFLFDLFLL